MFFGFRTSNSSVTFVWFLSESSWRILQKSGPRSGTEEETNICSFYLSVSNVVLVQHFPSELHSNGQMWLRFTPGICQGYHYLKRLLVFRVFFILFLTSAVLWRGVYGAAPLAPVAGVVDVLAAHLHCVHLAHVLHRNLRPRNLHWSLDLDK